MYRVILLSLFFFGCGSVKKVRNGTMAYEFKQYAVAISMLEEELHEQDDLYKRLLLARSYDQLDKWEEATDQYRAYLGESDDLDVLLEFARLLKKNERYDEAIDIFNILKTEAGLDPVVDRGLASCLAAKKWKANPDTTVQLKLMTFNSESSEYSCIKIDGRWVYTSDQMESENSPVYSWTGKGYSDLLTLGGQGSISFSDKINSPDNEGTAVLHPNGEDLYFTRCSSEGGDDAKCHIYQSKRMRTGEWGQPVLVEGVNGPFNSRHPAFSEDGRLLFYSSDREDHIGGYDLYFSRFDQDTWSAGRPLSQMINTIGDEVFPFLIKDTLYFASDGHQGMGGLDIFYSYFNNDDQWVRPINMQTPYNSGGDDFAIWFDTTNVENNIKRKGTFSSNRRGGRGGDDIYLFEVETPVVQDKEKDLPWILTVKVLQPIYKQKEDPNSGIRKMSPVNGVRLSIGDNEYETDITGIISQKVDSTDVLKIRASKKGFLSDAREVDIYKEAEDRMVFVKLVIDPVVYGQEIILTDIYYDFNKWDIRPDARPSLDSLGRLMSNNPEIRIMLTSHTDCRGEDAFNMDLSQKRAESALNYLLGRGISENRLEAKGFGESQPKVECVCSNCSEDEHQKNRRTSFIILE